jgi:hypothetical protein
MPKTFDPWFLMCSSPQAAADNRERIKSSFGMEYWKWLERVVRNTPRNKRLPPEVPVDIEIYHSAIDIDRVGRGIIKKGGKDGEDD